MIALAGVARKVADSSVRSALANALLRATSRYFGRRPAPQMRSVFVCASISSRRELFGDQYNRLDM